MEYDNPLFNTSVGLGADRYANPYLGIAHRWFPRNIDHMLWWANFLLLRFGFYRSALQRISNYFITSLNIECDDLDAKKKYEEAFEALNWKEILSKGGLDTLAYSNLFLSVTPGFDRFLICPNCKRVSNIKKINDYDFSSKGKYTLKCSSCDYKGIHEVEDKICKDAKNINITSWNPREVLVQYDIASNKSQYFWKIPMDYKNNVLKEKNKFFSKYTPAVVYEALLKDKLLEFNDSNFLHVKFPTPSGLRTDGKAIPLCIYLFDDFFMLKVLQRYDEAITFEDIAPFRVISMAPDNNPQANSILMQSSNNWRGSVEQMIKEHRRDPGAYHMFPFPLQYQQLAGDGKNLIPAELMAQRVTNILNALNIPQELFNMNLQMQTVGPALRLFENSWSFLIGAYNQILQKIGDVVGALTGLPHAKIGILSTLMSDDMERKSIIGQLVASNSIARSTLLKLYDLDYEEQIREKKKEDKITKEIDEEEAAKEQLRQLSQGPQQQGGQQASTPSDQVEQAQSLAEQIFPLDSAQRRQELQKIKATDITMYGLVKTMLDDLGSQARSQGGQQAKQQSQNGQGQQQ